MAIEVRVRKLYCSIVPVDAANAELFEDLTPNGEYKAVLTQERNPKFHRKAFALLKAIYDAWETPVLMHKGQPVKKNMERLRKDLTILAGYYDVLFKYDGTMVLEAHSWAFANMDDETFGAMYSKLIDVALSKILTGYTKDDLEYHVERILRFA